MSVFSFFATYAFMQNFQDKIIKEYLAVWLCHDPFQEHRHSSHSLETNLWLGMGHGLGGRRKEGEREKGRIDRGRRCNEWSSLGI